MSGRTSLGDESGIVKEKPIQLFYRIDISKKPVHLDFIMRNLVTMEEKIAMKAIVEFYSDLKMKIAIDQEFRPLEFTDENSMVFSKIK